jgi:hypothetical protein
LWKNCFSRQGAETRLNLAGMDIAALSGQSEAEVFRGRAQQARLAAKDAVNARYREIFEDLAESYEQLARDAEWLRRTDAA